MDGLQSDDPIDRALAELAAKRAEYQATESENRAKSEKLVNEWRQTVTALQAGLNEKLRTANLKIVNIDRVLALQVAREVCWR